MEARNITIVSTKDQNRKVISSAATTLGELKNDLRQAGIDYTGMTFYEGLSHTELLADDSPLPQNVLYKGEPTNELVFMLTTPNKKIKSGVDTRAALYEAVKERNLQQACINKYGRNYTQCKSAELLALVEEHDAAATPTNNGAVATFLKTLVNYLEAEMALNSEEIANLRSMLKNIGNAAPAAPVSPYTDKEIEAMFANYGK